MVHLGPASTTKTEMMTHGKDASLACDRIPPRLREPSRGWAAPAGLGVLGLAVVVLFCFDPGRSRFYPLCIFHQTTGLLCPGCGGLRAVHQLLHGHLAAAVHLNALFVLALPLAAWLAVQSGIRKLRHLPAMPAIRPAWLWCALAVTLLFGILRNLPFAQVAWLAP